MNEYKGNYKLTYQYKLRLLNDLKNGKMVNHKIIKSQASMKEELPKILKFRR